MKSTLFTILTIFFLLESAHLINVSNKLRESTKQIAPNCFSPQNGVIGGAAWNPQGATTINEILNFQAYGNDIYVGFFDSSSSTGFSYAFIICGWGNQYIRLFANNDFSTDIASVNWTLNPSALNSFQIDFHPNTGAITLSINGDTVFNWADPNFQAGAYSHVMYSQYSSNVQICTGCFDPQNGVINGNNWQQNGVAFSGKLYFNAYGNDIYVGFFPSQQNALNGFIYAFIIAGWGDSYVNLYANNDFQNALTGTGLSVNQTTENSYQIVFNNNAKSLTLYVNGSVVLSYVDPNYQGNQAAWVNFSQYSSNVGICNPVTHVGPGFC